MTDISLKQYLTGRAADPTEGIRHLAPHVPIISIRDLIQSSFGYTFNLNSFDIRNTRSHFNDSDQVFFSLKIDDRKLPTFTKWMGDVSNGNYEVNLIIDPAISIGSESTVNFSYLIVNTCKGEFDPEALQITLGILTEGAGYLVKYLTGSGVVSSALTKALNELTKFLTDGCDGVVAIDTIGTEIHPLTGGGLANLTNNNIIYSESRPYPGRLSKDSDAYKEIYEKNKCGSVSDYSVNWSISRCPLPSMPKLSTDRNPFAVSCRINGEDCLSIFIVDIFGCVWERRVFSDRQFFVYRDAPPNTVTVGSPCAVSISSSYLGIFVVGENGKIFELSKGTKSWLWNDRVTIDAGLTDKLYPSPCVVSESSGNISVFVICDSGGLWELPFLGNGWQDLKPCGSPLNTLSQALSAIVDPSGQIRVFVTATNGHLYQYHPNSDDPWYDHGNPPNTSAVGVPSFVATPWDYIVGLVLGLNGHIYELSSTDGTNFTWKDHGLPPHSVDPTEPGGLMLIGLGTRSPSLIVTQEGYLGALVVGTNGDLNELYWDSGSWKWISIGPPPSKNSPHRIAVSDPSYVSTSSGYRGSFMSGKDGHLYELYHTGNNHDWGWKDHSA